jgi:hypothetical protein
VEALYNLIVGANLMSATFSHTYLDHEHLSPTAKSFRNTPRSNLEGCGVLHNITVQHNTSEATLDFHVFEI